MFKFEFNERSRSSNVLESYWLTHSLTMSGFSHEDVAAVVASGRTDGAKLDLQNVKTAFTRALLERLNNLTQSHSSTRIVVQHVTDYVEKLQVFWSVVDHIAIEWFSVISNVATA